MEEGGERSREEAGRRRATRETWSQASLDCWGKSRPRLFFVGEDEFRKAGFAEEASGLFGRSGIDVEAGAPLEAGNLGKFGDDLEMPVVVIVNFFADGRSVNHEVVRGAVEDDIETHQRVFQHAREAGVDGALIVFVRGAVNLGEQPHLEGKARGVGSDADEMFVLADDALAGIALLADDVAEDAALLFVVIVPAVVDFFADAAGNNGKRDELRMRVLDGSAGGFAVILEDEDIAETLVVLEVEHAVAISPQDVFDGARRKSSERGGVFRSLDNDFMSADAIHFVIVETPEHS